MKTSYAQKGAYKKKKLKAEQGKSRQLSIKLFNNMQLTLSKVKVYFAAILLSVVVIALLSANTAGSYSAAYFIELDFDHQPNITEVNSLLNGTIAVEKVNLQEGNRAIIELKGANYDQTTLDSISNDKVVNKYLYKRIPTSPLADNKSNLLTGILLIVVISGLAMLLLLRKLSWNTKLRVIALSIVPTTLFALTSAALGILISKTGLFGLNVEILEIYMSLTLMVYLLSLYLVISKEREQFADMLLNN
jgi:hypothetical protein